jgi:hypothetical protein
MMMRRERSQRTGHDERGGINTSGTDSSQSQEAPCPDTLQVPQVPQGATRCHKVPQVPQAPQGAHSSRR